MPTYEYECTACGKRFEAFQSIKEAPIKKCEHCKKNTARRLISAGAGLIFKGSGFYITDYKSKGAKDDAAKAEKAEKSEKPGGTDSKSESGSGDAKPSKVAEPKSDAKPASAKPGKKPPRA